VNILGQDSVEQASMHTHVHARTHTHTQNYFQDVLDHARALIKSFMLNGYFRDGAFFPVNGHLLMLTH
jgi:hypothetical protein